MPRVSVIVPTYNCARFLARALQSVLVQGYSDYEIIVVDDGSTDDSREVISRFDGKIKYLYQPNRGPSSARNLALSRASGELIAYLDADDIWYPQKLHRQVAFLDAHRECGLVHSDMAIIDEVDRVIHLRFNRETGRNVPYGYCTIDLLRRAYIQTATVLERREGIDHTANFDERLGCHEDYLRWILVAMEGMAIGYIDEPLTMYRWRIGSQYSNRRRVLEDLVRMFEILSSEKALALRLGREAADIVRARLYGVRKELAYLNRIEGRTEEARGSVISLLLESPLHTELYAEYLKACVPARLATRLKRLRQRWVLR